MLVDRLEAPASVDPRVEVERIEQLLTNNLSGSQLDLVMHGEGDPFAPGHVKPHQYDSKAHRRNKKDNELFLESEKNGLSKRNLSKSSPIQIDIQEIGHGHNTTETSSL